MFRDDFGNEDRRQVLALRLDASRLESGAAKFPTDDHRRLADLLTKAPPWLFGELSRGMFKKKTGIDDPRIKQVLLGFAERLALDPVVYGLSRVDLRTAILCRLERVADVSDVLPIVATRLKEESDYLASLGAEEKRRRRGFLRNAAASGFGLEEAMQQRQASDPVQTDDKLFDMAAFVHENPEIRSETGLVIRGMETREINAISTMWADGWRGMSPGSLLASASDGPMIRRTLAKLLDRAHRLFGVFSPDGELVGSISVNPAAIDKVEIGWFVAPAHRGHGVATAAARTMMARLAEAGVAEFGARTLTTNKESIAIMEKLGFSMPEGHLPTGTDIDWISMTADPDVLFSRDQAPGL